MKATIAAVENLEEFARRLRELPIGERTDRHSARFVELVTEFARSEKDAQTAKEFAQSYLAKPSDYSTTPSGLSAMMFELWAVQQPTIGARFIETILQGSDAYLVVFDGALSEQDIQAMIAQTGGFASKITPKVMAGTMNKDTGMVSDVSIFEVKPVKGLKKPKDPSAVDTVSNRVPSGTPVPPPAVKAFDISSTFQGAPAHESAHELAHRDRFDSGLTRSHYGSWALCETPTDDGPATTLLVTSRGAWAIDYPLEEAVDMVDAIASCYDDVEQCYIDATVEHALSELGAAEGRPVENVAEARSILATNRLSERDEVLRIAFLIEGIGEPKPDAEEDDEEETTDRMEKPLFYREDLQAYYDVLLTTGIDEKAALAKLRRKFKVREVVVTPTGEVRSPGVVERPASEKPTPVPVGPPDDGGEDQPQDDGEDQTDQPPQDDAKDAQPDDKKDEKPKESIVKKWARAVDVPIEEAAEVWKRSKTIAESSGEDRNEVFRRAMSLHHATKRAPASVDDAFRDFLALDSDTLVFEDWFLDAYPERSEELRSWTPSDMHEGVRSVRLPLDKVERYEKWRRVMNMSPTDIRSFHRTHEATTSVSVGGFRAFALGGKSSRRLLAMKSKRPEDWTEDEWNWSGRQINTIRRLLHMAGPLFQESGAPTEKLLLLRSWGHNPLRHTPIDEAEVLLRQRKAAGDVWSCPNCNKTIGSQSLVYESGTWKHRLCQQSLVLPDPKPELRRAANSLISALPSPDATPRFVGDLQEYTTKGVPEFATLKKAKTELSPDERKECMDQKAVWRFSPGRSATPAVWKAEVDGKTWYVTNTHRAYNATPTLQGAIRRYHDFIKSTA